jgi:hypothetical protein
MDAEVEVFENNFAAAHHLNVLQFQQSGRGQAHGFQSLDDSSLDEEKPFAGLRVPGMPVFNLKD